MKNEPVTAEASRRTEAGAVLPLNKSPVCHYEFDAATPVLGQRQPAPWDFTLCMKCGEILTFNEQMGVETPSLSNLMESDPEVNRMLVRAQRLIRKDVLRRQTN